MKPDAYVEATTSRRHDYIGGKQFKIQQGSRRAYGTAVRVEV